VGAGLADLEINQIRSVAKSTPAMILVTSSSLARSLTARRSRTRRRPAAASRAPAPAAARVAVADMLRHARLDTGRLNTPPQRRNRERTLNLLPYDR
jgi:hypothetical protein